MTCIAVIKNRRGKLVMAGDRKSSYSWAQATSMPGPKVKKHISGLLLGASGVGNLCNLFINSLNVVIPETKISIETFMQQGFKVSLTKALINAGYRNGDGLLALPNNDSLHALVGVVGKVYEVMVSNPSDDSNGPITGLIEIEEIGVPAAVGCGGSTAYPILLAERRRDGVSKKEHLALALEIAAEVSPGCNNHIDYISED